MRLNLRLTSIFVSVCIPLSMSSCKVTFNTDTTSPVPAPTVHAPNTTNTAPAPSSTNIVSMNNPIVSSEPITTSLPPNSPTSSMGTIYYHFYPESSGSVPTTSSTGLGESLNLQGDTYTNLILSNFIAGVMLGQTLQKIYPGIQFNKDYIYGTMFAQLLQENLNTVEYGNLTCSSSTHLIDPCTDQAAVMGAGQGGPYQINNFAFDQIYGTPTTKNSPGYSLLNYVAIQQNLGISFSQPNASPYGGVTPASFNNLYFGPMLTTYFHLNDVASLIALGQVAWTPPAFAASFATCMSNLKAIPNSPLDVIINYAYNQGYYGKLMASSTDLCAKNVNSFVSLANGTATNPYSNSLNAFNNQAEINTSYTQYPYQVRFYLDELYNKSSLMPQTTNHVIFRLSQLGNIFTNIINTLGYQNQSGTYVPPATVLSTSTTPNMNTNASSQAFNSALGTLGVSSNVLLDLSDAGNRHAIFALIESAIVNLEQNLGISFAQKTTVQLSSSSN